MSEEVNELDTGTGSVSMLDGVAGAEDIGSQSNAPTDTAGTWMDGMSEEQIGAIQNKGWKSPADLYSSYAELEKFRGVPADQILKKPKDGESYDEIYTALGRPESADKYVYNAPEGMEVSPIIGSIQEAAFQAGMSSEGFTKLTDAYNESVAQIQAEQAEQAEQARVADIESAKGEYGKDLDTVVATADATAIAMGWDQDTANTIREAMGVTGMLKFMSKIAEAVGEDTVNTSAIKSQYGKTRDQLVADKGALMTALSADPARLEVFNRGGGNDYEALKSLNEQLFG